MFFVLCLLCFCDWSLTLNNLLCEYFSLKKVGVFCKPFFIIESLTDLRIQFTTTRYLYIQYRQKKRIIFSFRLSYRVTMRATALNASFYYYTNELTHTWGSKQAIDGEYFYYLIYINSRFLVFLFVNLSWLVGCSERILHYVWYREKNNEKYYYIFFWFCIQWSQKTS